MPLTLSALAAANTTRMLRWHGEDNWSVSDWAVAAAGEMGEVCNAVKKLRRVEDGFANINDPGRQLTSVEAATEVIAEELADTLLYMLLLANKVGIDLEAAVVKKFNATSCRYGFPDRISAD